MHRATLDPLVAVATQGNTVLKETKVQPEPADKMGRTAAQVTVEPLVTKVPWAVLVQMEQTAKMLSRVARVDLVPWDQKATKEVKESAVHPGTKRLKVPKVHKGSPGPTVIMEEMEAMVLTVTTALRAREATLESQDQWVGQEHLGGTAALANKATAVPLVVLAETAKRVSRVAQVAQESWDQRAENVPPRQI